MSTLVKNVKNHQEIVSYVKVIEYSKMITLVSAQKENMKPVKKCVPDVPSNVKHVKTHLLIV